MYLLMIKIISKDGTTIACDKTGNGPALILIDGAFCYRDHGVSPKLVPLLSKDFTVYAYDRRGRGESGDTKPYMVDKEIEDLDAIIDATGEIPYICGLSSGAALLVKAIVKGSNAKKITLFEPPYVVINENDKKPPSDAKAVLESLVAQGQRGKAVSYFMTKVMGVPTIFILLFKIFGKKQFKKNEGVANTLSYDAEIMDNFSLPKDLLTKIALPTAVIGGDKSPGKLLSAAKHTAQNISNSEMILLKGQTHNVSMHVLAPELIRFFLGK